MRAADRGRAEGAEADDPRRADGDARAGGDPHEAAARLPHPVGVGPDRADLPGAAGRQTADVRAAGGLGAEPARPVRGRSAAGACGPVFHGSRSGDFARFRLVGGADDHGGEKSGRGGGRRAFFRNDRRYGLLVGRRKARGWPGDARDRAAGGVRRIFARLQGQERDAQAGACPEGRPRRQRRVRSDAGGRRRNRGHLAEVDREARRGAGRPSVREFGRHRRTRRRSGPALRRISRTPWQDPRHRPILAKTAELLDSGCLVAAICGATAALAEAGLLDNRPHTSNSLEFLTFFCPNYRGASFYRDEPVVVDGRLITTGSAGALLLAREVMRRLDVMSGEALEAWYHYYSTGEAAYFYALMGAVSDR
ncbi:MAG: hypothetical protein C6W55_08840 [Thermobacillus sp.]|nr:MAG: hypothetical protein C6W55_08840 [Thermobacillus sp.]